MSIYAWITLLVFLAYFALVYTASRTGWLERHNMTLALGFILMMRTQRGKELIDRISGRATKHEVLQRRIQELEGQLQEAEEALGAADSDEHLVKVVREYRETTDRLAAIDRGEEEVSDEQLKDLRYRHRSLEGQVDPYSKFKTLLTERDEEEVDADLERIWSEAMKRKQELDPEISSLRLGISDAQEELDVVKRSSDFPKAKRKAQRRARFWRAYGNVSIAIVTVFMLLMFGLLVWQSFLVVRIPPGLIKPQQMLGIPGVNPVIPLWYGIFGLAVAMLVHEFAHGILTRVGNMLVKSLGLLFLVVPIGAFVEPDEEQLSKVDRGRRSRVFAVGPATNIIAAMLIVALFAWGFMGSLEQTEEGVVLNFIIDEQEVELDNTTPVMLKTPASAAGLRPWCTLMSIEALTGPPLGPEGSNVSVLKENDDFQDTMARTVADQEVRLRWHYDGRHHEATVRLWNKGDVYGEDHEGQGYLGAGSYLLYEVPAGEYPRALAHPMDYVDGATSFRNMTFFYISLPFTRPPLQPPSHAITQAFEVTGPLAGLGDTGFWVFANLLYWIFWLNLMVGIFNALPAIPLDGGYIFRDGLSWLAERLRPSRSRQDVDAMALKLTLALSLLILLLILWQFIGPWFGAAVGL